MSPDQRRILLVIKECGGYFVGHKRLELLTFISGIFSYKYFRVHRGPTSKGFLKDIKYLERYGYLIIDWETKPWPQKFLKLSKQVSALKADTLDCEVRKRISDICEWVETKNVRYLHKLMYSSYELAKYEINDYIPTPKLREDINEPKTK